MINLDDVIFEKYLEGKIDNEHYLALLEKKNIYDEEYESFKVKKRSELDEDEADKDAKLSEEYEKLSNDARKRLASKYYTKGKSNIALTPAEYAIAKDHVKILKREGRFSTGMSVLGGGVTALNAYAATKNIKSNNKANKTLGSINAAGAAVSGAMTAKNIKDSIEHKKKIRKEIAERNKK